jgi:hypothetical protein
VQEKPLQEDRNQVWIIAMYSTAKMPSLL